MSYPAITADLECSLRRASGADMLGVRFQRLLAPARLISAHPSACATPPRLPISAPLKGGDNNLFAEIGLA